MLAVVRFCTLAVSILACAACDNDAVVRDKPPIAAPPAAGQIAVYATLDENTLRPVFDAFTEKTGTAVFLVTGDVQALSQKISHPGADAPADLFIAGTVAELRYAVNQGIFRPIRPESIHAQVAPQLRGPDRLWLSIATQIRGVVYNRQLVSDEELTTIVDYGSMTDVRWRQRLCLSSSGYAGNRSLLAMLINDNGIRPAEIMVRGWRANLAGGVYQSDDHLLHALDEGQCAIGIAGSSELAHYLQRGTETNVAAHWFADAGVLQVDAIGAGVTRHAHNAELAEFLLEWLLSESGNTLVAERTLHFPVNSRALTGASISAWSGIKGSPVGLASLGFLLEDAASMAERARYR